MSKRNIILLIFVLLISLIVISSGSYAYWSWRSASNTEVSITVASGYSCSANGGVILLHPVVSQ